METNAPSSSRGRTGSREIGGGWSPGPRRPRLAADAVHVWRADLCTVSEEALGWLSLDERERAARFPRERDGRLWARARGVLRGLVARYLSVEPAAVQFRLDGRGKPGVALRGSSARLSFNLSHSGALALYAFTRAASVGVDVQSAPTRPIDVAAIARRAFGPGEGRRLAALAPAQRGREFLRAWARHEASLKCRGGGADASAGDVAERAASAGLWVTELDMGIGAAGAVALQNAAHEIRCWSWSGADRATDAADGASAV
jgi:4'-phosphopantetheinyl transferase